MLLHLRLRIAVDGFHGVLSAQQPCTSRILDYTSGLRRLQSGCGLLTVVDCYWFETTSYDLPSWPHLCA
jgi:hypothetical protein